MDPMGSLGELSLGDIGRALGRYKPVAATVLAILLALAVLPEPERPPGLASTGTGADIATPRRAAPASVSGATDGTVGTDAGVAGDSFSPSVTSGTTSFPSFSSGSSFSAGTTSDSASSDFPSGSSSDGGSSTSNFGPITSGTSTVDTTGEPPAPKPLRVVAAGWASRTGGTPLAKEGVPAGTLPVGARATTDDKITFVRLAGDGTSLGFAADPAGNREVSGPPKIQACKITEKWEEAEGIPLPDAPTHSETKCVQGTLAASGIWVFDLSSFEDRADELGFALVPGDGAGVDWQVAFKR